MKISKTISSIFFIFFFVSLVSILVFLNSLPAFYMQKMGYFLHESINFQIVSSLSAFFVMFILPLVLALYIQNKTMPEIGLGYIKNKKNSIRLTSYFFVFYIFIVFILSKNELLQSYYSTASERLLGFTSLFIITSAIYYFSEEFLFRGFLLFNLEKYVGLNSIWLSSGVFALFHIGKPWPEVYFSFILGLGLGYLSIKTRTIWPSFFIHFCLALMLNALVIFSLL